MEKLDQIKAFAVGLTSPYEDSSNRDLYELKALVDSAVQQVLLNETPAEALRAYIVLNSRPFEVSLSSEEEDINTEAWVKNQLDAPGKVLSFEFEIVFMGEDGKYYFCRFPSFRFMKGDNKALLEELFEEVIEHESAGVLFSNIEKAQDKEITDRINLSK